MFFKTKKQSVSHQDKRMSLDNDTSTKMLHHTLKEGLTENKPILLCIFDDQPDGILTKACGHNVQLEHVAAAIMSLINSRKGEIDEARLLEIVVERLSHRDALMHGGSNATH